MIRESHHNNPEKDTFPRFSPTWLRLLLIDLKDNIHSEKVTPTVYREGAPNPALAERIVPSDVRDAIIAAGKELPVGVEHAMTYIVGKFEDGTQHPHRLVVVRDEHAVNAFYLDPEDIVGIATKKSASMKKTVLANVIRAQIVNMLSMRLPLDGTMPTTVLIRYQTSQVEDADNLEVQLQVAKDLLSFNKVPTALRGIEKNITTRVYAGAEGTLLQDRNSDPVQLTKAIDGESGSHYLQDRLQSGRISLRRTVNLFQTHPLIPRTPEGFFSSSKRV